MIVSAGNELLFTESHSGHLHARTSITNNSRNYLAFKVLPLNPD